MLTAVGRLQVARNVNFERVHRGNRSTVKAGSTRHTCDMANEKGRVQRSGQLAMKRNSDPRAANDPTTKRNFRVVFTFTCALQTVGMHYVQFILS